MNVWDSTKSNTVKIEAEKFLFSHVVVLMPWGKLTPINLPAKFHFIKSDVITFLPHCKLGMASKMIHLGRGYMDNLYLTKLVFRESHPVYSRFLRN